MAMSTRPRKIAATVSSRGRGRDVRRFERTVLPAHARVEAELSFTHKGERTTPVLITDLSPLGIGVVVSKGDPAELLPPLRRRVDVTLPGGHVLEGVVADKYNLEGADAGLHRVGIELRAAGTTFEELRDRPQKLILDLREGLHEVLPCSVEASLPLLSGITHLEGAVTAVSLECAVVNFPYLHPGLFLGLEVVFQSTLPEGEMRLEAEVSDLLPARAGAGVDVLLTFDSKPTPFLSAFSQFYMRQRLVLVKRQLSAELVASGFLLR
jgi:hypothetical protein